MFTHIASRVSFPDWFCGLFSLLHSLLFLWLKETKQTSYDIRSCAGIARCFTFGGSRNRVLHDPAIQPRSDLSQECYMKKEEQTTLNHFYEKLLKLKDLMKTKVKGLGFQYIRPTFFGIRFCSNSTCLLFPRVTTFFSELIDDNLKYTFFFIVWVFETLRLDKGEPRSGTSLCSSI